MLTIYSSKIVQITAALLLFTNPDSTKQIKVEPISQMTLEKKLDIISKLGNTIDKDIKELKVKDKAKDKIKNDTTNN